MICHERIRTDMKKKSIFLLASVAMSAALVGGTFASWAVTDNADPFSIKVSTGDVSTDTTEYVTLEWGEQQSMSHVSNLALDTVRKAGVLDLRANTSSTTQTDGTLSYSMDGGSHLLAKLQVKVYAGNLSATDGVIPASELSGKTPLAFVSGSKVIQVSKNVANLYTVAVSLAETTAAELAEMSGEQVSITFDWGPGTDIATTTTLYATGFSGTPKAYAWTGSTQTADFPGVDMKEVVAGSGVYTVEIPAAMQNVIFSYDDNYGDDANRQQSGDLAIASVFTEGKNMFTFDGTSGEAKGTFSVFDPSSVKVPTYYVVGDFSSPAWSALPANMMTVKSGKTDEFELSGLVLSAGAKIKVFEQLHNMYYGCDSTWDNCGFTLDSDHNLVVTAAGTYKIHVDLSPEGAGNYVDITKTA